MPKEYTGRFNDALTFNTDTKRCRSVRDGWLEYHGYEISMEPAEKVFRVYRSPATIANVNSALNGIPLTDEHVDPDVEFTPVGSIVSGLMVDHKDASTGSTLAIENQVQLSPEIMAALETGKRELSLGYDADLVPYSGDGGYDLEQRNIIPHHLAVVTRGRCGSSCSFIDAKPTEAPPMKFHKAFTDAEGQLSLESVVEIATNLPEALKKMPLDKIQEIMPALQEAIAESGAQAAPDAPAPAEEVPAEDADPDVEEVADEDSPAVEDEDPEDEENPKGFADSAAFQDAVESAVKQHATIIEKARGFVSEGYTFSDKSGDQIMRDALESEGYEAKSFSDSELAVAFKMLKKQGSNLKTFGDSAVSKDRFASLYDKEL